MNANTTKLPTYEQLCAEHRQRQQHDDTTCVCGHADAVHDHVGYCALCGCDLFYSLSNQAEREGMARYAR